MVSQKRQLGPSHFICNGGSWLADQCCKSEMWVGGGGYLSHVQRPGKKNYSNRTENTDAKNRRI